MLNPEPNLSPADHAHEIANWVREHVIQGIAAGGETRNLADELDILAKKTRAAADHAWHVESQLNDELARALGDLGEVQDDLDQTRLELETALREQRSERASQGEASE